MLKCPGRYAPSFDLYTGESSFWRERSAAYRMRREGTGCFWVLPVDLECVVPGTRWIDLPICMWQFSPKLPPLLVDLERVHQRASFDRDTIVVARLRAHWHGQVQTDGYRLAPFAHYTMERATRRWLARGFTQRHSRLLGPGRNTQEEREMHRMFSRYHDMPRFLEGIIAVHFHPARCPSYHCR